MSGGKRTDRISRRDRKVLGFIARFGMVPRSAVETWAGTGQRATLNCESRLLEAGLIELCVGIVGASRLVRATRLGLRLLGHGDLRVAASSLVMADHSSAVATLAASLERDGDEVLSERELLARERRAGMRMCWAKLGEGRFHYPDLIRLGNGAGPPEAIEVKLTPKVVSRLDDYLLAWAKAVAERRLSCVSYRCPPQTYSLLERAVERTGTQGAVVVQEL